MSDTEHMIELKHISWTFYVLYTGNVMMDPPPQSLTHVLKNSKSKIPHLQVVLSINKMPYAYKHIWGPFCFSQDHYQENNI